MSTLHLVEIDADENIVEEIEVDDDILQALEKDEDTELSLSDEANDLYLVELDDNGEIADAVAIGQDDDETEDTELSLESRVDGLELSIASMLGKGAIGAGRAIVGKARSGFGAVKKSFKHGGAGDTFVRKNFGHKVRTAAVKTGRAIDANPIKSAAAAGAVGGFGVGSMLNKKRKPVTLSLSAEDLLTNKNPLLADVESRTAK